MTTPIARSVAETFLRGALDVFDALLSRSFTPEIQDIADIAIEEYEELLALFPVIWRAKLRGEDLAVVMLMKTRDAIRLHNMVAGVPDDKISLAPEDLELLREVAESSLGGGIAALMELSGRSPQPIEQVHVGEEGTAAAGTLVELLDTSARRVRFAFEAAADFVCEGILLYPPVFEQWAAKAAPAAAATPPQAALTEAEMSDILSGIGGPAGIAGPASDAPAAGPAPVVHGNMDMILDIQMVATARLGRVEMPISDILALGPGSILEVGHLVDEPIELLVNGKLIARGDVVVVDEKFGLRITEIVSPRMRIESLR